MAAAPAMHPGENSPRLEAIILDGSACCDVDWSRYLKRVEELVTTLLSISIASAEPEIPFRFGVARGRQLVHFTQVLADDTQGTTWSSELCQVMELLQLPVGVEPGVMALQSLKSRVGDAWPMHATVFITSAGSRSLEARLLDTVISSVPAVDLELLVVPDGIAQRPFNLDIELILLQANRPLKISVLETSPWDWSMERFNERRRIEFGLEVNSCSVLCTARPAVVTTQLPYQLEACSCHGEIIHNPVIVHEPVASENTDIRRCPCSGLALDGRDVNSVVIIGRVRWPSHLCSVHDVMAVDGGDSFRYQAIKSSSRGGKEDTSHGSLLHASRRVKLSEIPLVALLGDPWIVSANMTSLEALPIRFTCLARQLHDEQHGLVCTINLASLLRRPQRSGFASRSFAAFSRVVLLPQGAPHTTLLLKFLAVASPLIATPAEEMEMPTNRASAVATDHGEEQLVAGALKAIIAATDLYPLDKCLGGDGAAASACLLRSSPSQRIYPRPSLSATMPLRSEELPLEPESCNLFLSACDPLASSCGHSYHVATHRCFGGMMMGQPSIGSKETPHEADFDVSPIATSKLKSCARQSVQVEGHHVLVQSRGRPPAQQKPKKRMQRIVIAGEPH
eukprot:scaffold9017_cov32-Tisochrysis_lutea.AAC.1